MRISVLLFFLLLMAIPLAGCSPAIDAELKLIDASRHGITLVKAGVGDRQASLAAMQAAARARLDAAFDADVKAQPQPINPDWIVDARRAYAAAIDAQTQQQLRTQKSAEVDQANLDAIDQALQELDLLNRTQRQLVPNLNLFTKGMP